MDLIARRRDQIEKESKFPVKNTRKQSKASKVVPHDIWRKKPTSHGSIREKEKAPKIVVLHDILKENPTEHTNIRRRCEQSE